MKQKIFRITIIISLLITSLLCGSIAYAQDEELPDPGITPDSPLYFFDTMGKNVGMFFAFGPEAKARKALEYAEERLAEARVMADKNRARETTRAANDYDGFMAMVNERAAEVRQQDVSDNLSEGLALAADKHIAVLERIQERAPEAAREAVTRAKTKSREGQVNALRAIAKNKPERALELSSDIIEEQMERVRVRVTENVTASVSEALDYAIRIAELEDEMAAIAEEKGIDITAIQQRLAQSTSNRLETLSRVYEKVPETARPAVENAIENSVRKYERTAAKLREKNALGDIPEEDAVFQRIQAEVREKLKVRTSTQAPGSDNTTVQVRTQTETKERVEEKVKERRISEAATEKPEPAVSANRVREKDDIDDDNDDDSDDDNDDDDDDDEDKDNDDDDNKFRGRTP
ncbi:DUF5667 domain-containing protein [Chloroflexota bacterium]